MNVKLTCYAILANVVFASSTAFALPTQVAFIDTPQCDPLFIPTNVEEIGDAAVFPPDESLLHADLGLANPVCLPTDNPTIPDALVSITNVTTKNFSDVWYVADRDTSITNFDGEANDIAFFPPGQEAFHIDRVGLHRPLLFESAGQNGIWEAGEEWRFVLQDYMHPALPPDAITSRGVGDASVDVAGFVASSGSIIAIVPEPAGAVLALLGLSAMGFVPRRQRS